jgi:rod shape-determining protein MreD
MPAMIGALLVLVCAVPMAGGALTYTPNVAWLLTLTMVAANPRAWSPLTAFAIGLLQDVLFATPLGSQALLALLLMIATRQQATRQQTQNFRVRWLEAALVLVVWHGLLWLVVVAVTHADVPMRPLLVAGAINALWYPLFYGAVTRMFASHSGVK